MAGWELSELPKASSGEVLSSRRPLGGWLGALAFHRDDSIASIVRGASQLRLLKVYGTVRGGTICSLYCTPHALQRAWLLALMGPDACSRGKGRERERAGLLDGV